MPCMEDQIQYPQQSMKILLKGSTASTAFKIELAQRQHTLPESFASAVSGATMTMNPFWAAIAVTAILASQFPVAQVTPLLVGRSRNSSQLSIDVKGASRSKLAVCSFSGPECLQSLGIFHTVIEPLPALFSENALGRNLFSVWRKVPRTLRSAIHFPES